MRASLFTATAAMLVALVTGMGCADSAAEFRRPGCNVILISIDTLRADRLGCYGCGRDTSPNIDRFREDGALFRCTIASAPSTMPSHASIFTSLSPGHHGALISQPTPLAEDRTTMAELLKAAGYHTVSYNDGGQISAEFGFDQGFDDYVTLPNEEHEVYDFINTVHETRRWLDRKEETPFFLFLHTYHTHHPYTPARQYLDALGVTYDGKLLDVPVKQLHKEIESGHIRLNREDGAYFSSLYDAEVRQMDDAFGKLVQLLRNRSLYEESLIVFTSDHGEELGEHGHWGWHSHTLFEELLRVPLIIKFPGGAFAGATVERQVRSLDILPTVLDITGNRRPKVLEGRSLLPLLDGDSDGPRPVLAQMDCNHLPTSLRASGWKYYPAAPGYIGALYRIEDDPQETDNLVTCEPETAREMERLLGRLERQRPPAAPAGGMALSPEVTDQLKRLGYID